MAACENPRFVPVNFADDDPVCIKLLVPRPISPGSPKVSSVSLKFNPLETSDFGKSGDILMISTPATGT